MSPAIASLARKLGMPIMLYRIEGGYGVQPRWSDGTRRGKMRGYVARVIEPEEYKELSDAELFDIIKTTLYVSEAKVDGEYHSKHLAEYLERAIYYCPDCGLTTLHTEGDLIRCTKCGKTVRYLPTKELLGVNCDFPYRFVLDWYKAEEDFMNSLDLTEYYDKVIYTDRAEIKEVIPSVKKIPVGEADITLLGNGVKLDFGSSTIDCPFDDCSTITVLGRNKLNIYHGGKIYQLKGDKRFGALKYVHIYNRYKNIQKGDENDKFLGL
jgi:DNA-directed RNA polymerase subunit RPC12/RpoP